MLTIRFSQIGNHFVIGLANSTKKIKHHHYYILRPSHGSKGSMSGLNRTINRKTILNELKKAKNIQYVHFGSCLFGNQNNLKLILTKAKHIKWAAGYNKSVDWIDSTLFDILFWGKNIKSYRR